VIALDFFAQFDPPTCSTAKLPANIAAPSSNKAAPNRAPDGSGFLGRDEAFSAFSDWLNEEFEGELAESSR